MSGFKYHRANSKNWETFHSWTTTFEGHRLQVVSYVSVHAERKKDLFKGLTWAGVWGTDGEPSGDVAMYMIRPAASVEEALSQTHFAPLALAFEVDRTSGQEAALVAAIERFRELVSSGKYSDHEIRCHYVFGEDHPADVINRWAFALHPDSDEASRVEALENSTFTPATLSEWSEVLGNALELPDSLGRLIVFKDAGWSAPAMKRLIDSEVEGIVFDNRLDPLWATIPEEAAIVASEAGLSAPEAIGFYDTHGESDERLALLRSLRQKAPDLSSGEGTVAR